MQLRPCTRKRRRQPPRHRPLRRQPSSSRARVRCPALQGLSPSDSGAIGSAAALTAPFPSPYPSPRCANANRCVNLRRYCMHPHRPPSLPERQVVPSTRLGAHVRERNEGYPLPAPRQVPLLRNRRVDEQRPPRVRPDHDEQDVRKVRPVRLGPSVADKLRGRRHRAIFFSATVNERRCGASREGERGGRMRR